MPLSQEPSSPIPSPPSAKLNHPLVSFVVINAQLTRQIHGCTLKTAKVMKGTEGKEKKNVKRVSPLVTQVQCEAWEESRHGHIL